jgi:hypothetical protein
MGREQTIDRRRRLLLQQALALGFAAGGWPLAQALQPPARRLSVQAMYGPVWINGLRATETMPIGPADHLETGHEAQLIALVGGDALLLRGNTELQLVPGPRPSFQLLGGAVLASFAPRSQGIELQTPTATVGMQGGCLYAALVSGRSYICTCEGHARLSARSNAKVAEDVVGRRHEAARYVLERPQGGRLIEPARFAGHNEAERVTLETLAGRRSATPPARTPNIRR